MATAATTKGKESEAGGRNSWVLAMSALSHLLWGLHPVCSRYLQTRAGLDGVNLLAVAQLSSLLLNPIVTRIVNCVMAGGSLKNDAASDTTTTGLVKTRHGSGNREGDEEEAEAGKEAEAGEGFCDSEPLVRMAPRTPQTTEESLEATLDERQGSNHGSRQGSNNNDDDEVGESDHRGGGGGGDSKKKNNRWTKAQVAGVFGALAAVRALTNILSSRFTRAYNVQLVAMGGPFVTSIISHCLIGEVLPWTLWPALIVAALGQALFVSAQAGYFLAAPNGDGGDGGSSGNGGVSGLNGFDWLGMGLQFVSLFFSAGARVVMKTSAGVIRNPADLMAAQYLCCSLPALLYSTLAAMPPPPQTPYPTTANTDTAADTDYNEAAAASGGNGEGLGGGVGSVWLAWAALSAMDWAVFLTLTVGVVTVGATIQVHCIRVLGPSGHTVLQPLRLIATVAASALLLGEAVGGGGGFSSLTDGDYGATVTFCAEWTGLVVVLAALAWFITVGKALGMQHHHDHQAATAEEPTKMATTTTTTAELWQQQKERAIERSRREQQHQPLSQCDDEGDDRDADGETFFALSSSSAAAAAAEVELVEAPAQAPPAPKRK